jgi:hypothetical protein
VTKDRGQTAEVRPTDRPPSSADRGRDRDIETAAADARRAQDYGRTRDRRDVSREDRRQIRDQRAKIGFNSCGRLRHDGGWIDGETRSRGGTRRIHNDGF